MQSVTFRDVEVIWHVGISTHTLHAERDSMVYRLQELRKISTHTLHAERDWDGSFDFVDSLISTHTLHAERDENKGYYKLN